VIPADDVTKRLAQLLGLGCVDEDTRARNRHSLSVTLFARNVSRQRRCSGRAAFTSFIVSCELVPKRSHPATIAYIEQRLQEDKT
jgi:hypothetical protein